MLSRKTRRNLVAYSFIAPNFIGFAVFTLGPVIFAFVLTFSQWNGNGAITFDGLNNFIKMKSDTRFWVALKNTVVYAVSAVPFTLASALGMALLLNSRIRGREVFRAAAFFPYVASIVACTAVWNIIFSPGAGLVNVILNSLGAQHLPKWAADKHWAMFTVVLFSIWKDMGYYMVIDLAGLQGISPELYEAAGLDGAGPLQKFRYITWPQLKPTTFFIIIMLTINSFKIYDRVMLITGGGPGTETLVLVYHIYDMAFVNSRFGYASALAVVLFVLVLTVTIIQFKGEKHYANS
ncbi:MAG: sugar ABC transporter permease [Hungatella sp.]|nr:sugar ABC transporter permease [Hungatella sp.]